METCPLLPIRTIKTIRIRYNQAEKFLSDPEMPNFKLIALFRDPRGTWNSRRVMKWSREIANVSMVKAPYIFKALRSASKFSNELENLKADLIFETCYYF